ncbi:hypothetical protein U1Q18_027188, partial [Sarracenia purpurea var. burkii]
RSSPLGQRERATMFSCCLLTAAVVATTATAVAVAVAATGSSRLESALVFAAATTIEDAATAAAAAAAVATGTFFLYIVVELLQIVMKQVVQLYLSNLADASVDYYHSNFPAVEETLTILGESDKWRRRRNDSIILFAP